MKTIVSVTPVAVTSDSRTYKMAASFTRFGFKSIVVEGLKSNVQPQSMLFSLLHVQGDVIFSKADGSRKNPVLARRLSAEWFKYWWLRLTKPFMNQVRTFISLPRASIYYLHSFYQWPAVFLKSMLVSAIYIYDAHDYYLAENPGRLNRWLEALCIKYAGAIVTVSRGVAALLEKEYGCKPVVIRNCHDSRIEETPSQNLRQTLGLSAEDFLLVVVGQAKDGMAIREALEAMRNMPSHVHIAFVGKNTQKYSVYVEQAQLGSQVHLVPPVIPSQIVPFIRSANAALILYYPRTENYENCLPNGFFQSVSAKLPILYPDLPEISRLAVEYQLGISINTQSAYDIANGILYFVENNGAHYKDNLAKASCELSWEREELVLRDLVENFLFYSSWKQK